jgi:ABC-type multidrug transport system, ATPase and permease components
MKLAIRLLKEAKKYYGLLFATVVCMLVLTAAQLVTPLIVRQLTMLIETKDANLAQYAVQLAILLAAIYLVLCAAQGLRSYLAHKAAWNYVSDMRVKLYNHFQDLSMDFYQDKQIGQLMSRVTSDTNNLELLIAHAVPDLIVNIFLFVGVSVLLFTINVKLALVSFIVLPFLAVTSVWFAKSVRGKFRIGQETMGELNAELQDNLSGIREINLFNRQRKEGKDVSKLSKKHIGSLLSALKRGAVYHPGIQLFSNIGMVFVIGYGGYLASIGEVSLSSIIAFIMYLGIFYQPISELSRINEDIQNSFAGAERIFEMLDIDPSIKDIDGAVPLENPRGKLEFSDVSFQYDDHAQVLKNLSFVANPGEMIAFVGQTGVGKTTIVSLLSRFYDPVSGGILLDDHNLRDITLHSLRDSMSVVLQDVFLFNGTVEENIRYGQPDATKEQIENAARLAHAHEFIEHLENGYDTFIGERGIKLSGGQKQRLSIARAILRNRPILILDEATSAVDVETEKLIQDAMDKVMENRTTIIIAHRLSTVKKADKIIVLEKGEIAEEGTHEQLLAKGGIYTSYSGTQFAV